MVRSVHRASLLGLALSIPVLTLTSVCAVSGATANEGSAPRAVSECLVKVVEGTYPCVFPRTNCQSYATNMKMATNLFDLRNSAPQAERAEAKIDLLLYEPKKLLPPFWRTMNVDSTENVVLGTGADLFTWGIFHTPNESVRWGPMIRSEYPTGIHVSGGDDVYTVGVFIAFKLNEPPARQYR